MHLIGQSKTMICYSILVLFGCFFNAHADICMQHPFNSFLLLTFGHVISSMLPFQAFCYPFKKQLHMRKTPFYRLFDAQTGIFL